MSTEENKALVRRVYEEAINRGNMAVVDELNSPNYVAHDPGFPQPVRGPEGLKQYFLVFRSAFPDVHITIEDMIAEGDTIAVRQTSRGTHQGDLRGIPPTGKQITVTGLAIHKIANGKFVESWINADSLGLLQQLGVIPSMG
jgi:steroid delta-isomerase-like uncharacterized protein